MRNRISFIVLIFVSLCNAPFFSSHAGTVAYQYDALSRLTKVIYNRTQSITYKYDKAGNIISTVKGPYSQPAGDINGNDIVELSDGIMALQIMTNIAPILPISGDANSDGRIGLAEVIFILQQVAGMR